MNEFFKFWRDCFTHGFHIAEGAFTIVDIVALTIAAIFIVKKFKEKDRNRLDEKAIIISAGVFAVSLFVSTCFFAPFQIYQDISKELKNENEMSLTIVVHNVGRDKISIGDKISGAFVESIGSSEDSWSSHGYKLYTVDGKNDHTSFTIESGKSKEFKIRFSDDAKSMYEKGAADFNFGIFGSYIVTTNIPFNSDSIHGEPISITFTN